jgi:hypothetical protein
MTVSAVGSRGRPEPMGSTTVDADGTSEVDTVSGALRTSAGVLVTPRHALPGGVGALPRWR